LDFAVLIRVPESQHLVCDGSDTVETPTIFSDGLGTLVLDGGFWVEAVY
jgi:hypothetical protein